MQILFKYTRALIVASLAFLITACGSNDKDSYDLYLLIGQSNMSGRGKLDGVLRSDSEAVFMQTEEGEWVPATDPLHFDKPDFVGVGPGLTFGIKMAEALKLEGRKTGLIPAAAGGSPIAAWAPGGYHDQTDSRPYDEAVARTLAAMKDGTLKGIIWHQGESDANAKNLPAYKNALTQLITDLRRDLDAPNVPFILGGLGTFLESAEAVKINAILEDLPNIIPLTGFVSANGLSDKGDGSHFSSQSARILGASYARKMLEMQTRYDGYALVWSDEFNTGTMPDTEKWNYRTGDGCPKLCGFGNGEWQVYTDGVSKNARIENGRLIIQSHNETIGNAEYSSARLNSRYKGDWIYGRFEIRAIMPTGRGTWPAIWMMPSDMEYGDWPKSGEIDIMEHVGYKPDEVSGTVHTEHFNHMIGTHKGVHHPYPGSEDNFFTYGIEWTPEKIDFFVDDEVYFSFENTGKGAADFPFDKRFYMILNLAIGGNLGGQQGVDPTAFPTHMEIDYVRVYQRDN